MWRKVVRYIKDSRSELKKVIWPNRKETVNQTILVVAISGAVALILGIIDFLLTKVITLIIH